MLDIGIQEVLVIMVLALLVFGPDKLPELGRRLGRAMREFRRASDEFRRTVETNLHLDEDHVPLPPSAVDSTRVETAAPGPETGAGAGMEAATAEMATVTAGEAEEAGGGPSEEPVTGEAIEPFWMTRGGRLLHRAGCGWRRRVPEADRIPLKAATDGWDLGLASCPVCDPRAAEVLS